MPIKKEREYRALAAPLTAQSATKLIQTEYYVEGYATTFDAPYLLYEFEDGTKIYERIDAHALDGADMSDVIMQYDHEGRVFARQSNKTLILQPDYKGLKVAADLGKTDLARGLYQDIEAGMINKMSWAFSVAEESYDRETHTRTILKIKKVYDVSAVSIPANGDTEISARAFASRLRAGLRYRRISERHGTRHCFEHHQRYVPLEARQNAERGLGAAGGDV